MVRNSFSRSTLTTALLAFVSIAFGQAPITITVLHTNDLHARAEPAKIRGKEYGGYARQATLIKRLRAETKNTVLLNGGDTFQGTLFFNVYEGLADAAIMNMIGYEAMAVGNHEFDRGPATLATFARQVRFPLLAANLDVSADAGLKDWIKPYAVLEVGGQKLGVVGAITPSTPTISSPGENVKFKSLVPAVQAAIDELTKQGVNKIVLVSHCGYGEERELVSKVKGLDAVVGGHSHSLLGADFPFEGWPRPAGAYPTMVNDSEGRAVPVVQAWEWGKVVGCLTLDFDAQGRLVSVPSAKVVAVDESIPADLNVASAIAAFKKPIEGMGNAVVGQAEAEFLKDRPGGSNSALDNAIADSMLEATAKMGVVAAFINAGGVRAPLDAGPITVGELKEIQPFDNTLVVLDMTGDEVLKSLEHGSGGGGLLLPSAGTSYKIDRSKPAGGRVSDVVLGGQPLELTKTYKVVTYSFIAGGGDAHEQFKNAKGTRVDTGLIDADVFVEFVRKHSPLKPNNEARVLVVRPALHFEAERG